MAAWVPSEWKSDGADKRASADRHLLCLDGGRPGPRLNWSHGETHCKLITVVLSVRHAGLHCVAARACTLSYVFD